jgi:hypothetical protein
VSEHGYSVQKDLSEAEAMARALVPYVHEDELYGSVGSGGFFSGGGRMPSLTIGALLMRIRRLNMLRDRLNDEQTRRLEAVEARNAEIHNEWRVHYERKMIREANSRLDAMKAFFEECDEDPALCARVYGPEASRRTIVEEIMLAMEQHNIDDADLRRKARSSDNKLRGYLEPSDFVWVAELKPAYPEKTFWWLYHRPPNPKK